MPDSADHIAALERRITQLERTVAQLRARDTTPEWLALGSCDYSPFTYQTARTWCEEGLIDAYQDKTRHWYAWNRADRSGHPPSLKTYLVRKGVQQRSA
jgi:hypothetical protein